MSFPYKAERCWYCRGKNQRCGECLHFDGYASAKDHAIAKLQDHITELEGRLNVTDEKAAIALRVWLAGEPNHGSINCMKDALRAALRGEG